MEHKYERHIFITVCSKASDQSYERLSGKGIGIVAT